MGREKLLAMTFIIPLLVLSASAIELNTNATSLPFSSNLTLVFDINETSDIEYGMFLSGQSTINGSNMTEMTVEVTVLIPEDTNPGTYSSYVRVGNMTEDVSINIIDDIVFGFSIDKEYCFVDDKVTFESIGPEGSIVYIEAGDEIINTTPGTTVFTPSKEKEYDVKATISFRNKTQVFEKTFAAYKKLICSITSKDDAYNNESIVLSGDATGGVGTLNYRWTADDIKKDTRQVTYNFKDTGKHTVTLKVSDKKGNTAVCKKTIKVSERVYDITISAIDNATGKALGDVNITINNATEKTNVKGHSLFTGLTAGKYILKAQRHGFLEYENTIDIGNKTKFEFQMMVIPEEEKPLPKVTLISPKDEDVVTENNVVFTYKVSSVTKVDRCFLLVNEVKNLGYKVKGKVTDVKLDTELEFITNLSNARYKWTVRCENDEGINKSADWLVDVKGIVPKDKGVEIVKALPQANLSAFDVIIKKIDAVKNRKYNADEQDVFDALGLGSILAKSKTEVHKLKNKMNNLATLKVSELDMKKQKDEIYSELEDVKKKIPDNLKIIRKEEYTISADEQDTKDAVEEYIRWKNYSLSDRELKRYIKKVLDAQKEMKVSTKAISAEIAYLNGAVQPVSIIMKDIKSNKTTGVLFFESISKIMAEDVDSVHFSVPYELVNKDPVVHIYTDAHPAFSYFIHKKVDVSDKELSNSVLLLDLTSPQNKITGFSVLGGGSGAGAVLMIFILLGIVLGGNYLIFFRDADTRKTAMSRIINATSSLKPKSNTEKLTGTLNMIMELLKDKNLEEALKLYPKALEHYKKADKKVCDELHPIIAHLHYELEIFNVNKMIDDAYTKALNGKCYEAMLPYDEIQEILYHIPDRYENKINPKIKNLSIQMQIHMMKEHNVILSRKDETVEDSLYDTR